MKKRMQALRIWALLWLTLSALQAQTAHYQVYGEGKTVLMLAKDDSKTSTELIDKLTEHSFQVIVPEINACKEALLQNDSRRMTARYAADDHATRLSREPCRGGLRDLTTTACRIAQLYPAQVDRIVAFARRYTHNCLPHLASSEGASWKTIESFCKQTYKHYSLREKHRT